MAGFRNLSSACAFSLALLWAREKRAPATKKSHTRTHTDIFFPANLVIRAISGSYFKTDPHGHSIRVCAFGSLNSVFWRGYIELVAWIGGWEFVLKVRGELTPTSKRNPPPLGGS